MKVRGVSLYSVCRASVFRFVAMGQQIHFRILGWRALFPRDPSVGVCKRVNFQNIYCWQPLGFQVIGLRNIESLPTNSGMLPIVVPITI